MTLPYAILEVKTQAEPPEWVSQLKSSGYLIPAPNFSKFLYGSCKLWPDKVEFTPLWWERVTELEKSIQTHMSSLHDEHWSCRTPSGEPPWRLSAKVGLEASQKVVSPYGDLRDRYGVMSYRAPV